MAQIAQLVAIYQEGTLSIVWRGEAYHVRYASTNPYAPEYPARVCPDKATLRALLHALATDAEALQYACTIARTASVAVLRLLVTPGQRQACFGPTTFQVRHALAPTGNRRDAALPSW